MYRETIKLMQTMQDVQGLDTEGTQHEHQEGNMHYITHVWGRRKEKGG